jgi:hypothetical protein
VRRDTVSITPLWEFTPTELCGFFRPDPFERAVTLTSIPFGTPKQPLEGTPYIYQYGVSETSIAVDITPLCKALPDLPRTGSGDRRSGIILYDRNLIIGCYLIPGYHTRGLHELVIHKNYHRQGLASRMVEQWFRQVPGVKSTIPQAMNTLAVRVFLKAHENIIKWALSNGKKVPNRVLKAVSEGSEKKAVLRRLEVIESTAH